MDDIRTRATEIWNQLAPWQRFAGIATVISAFGLLAVLGLWMREPSYALLYRNLSERDAAAVVNELENQRIPYRLVGDGTAIKVESSQVASARLKLAAQNLPQGGTAGFELFDGSALDNFGMTEFMQRVNYQRALEGELGRTITAIDGVEVARIHIAIPEESLFVEEQKQPKASVILKTTPGVHLKSGQIQAIRFLVANSVEGLEVGNISVADVDGTLYDPPKTDGELSAMAVTSNQLEVKRRFETETQNGLQAMLDQTLGPKKAVVRVNAEMNWDREETVKELYAPAGEVGSVVRSTNQTEESWVGAGESAAGVPGVDPNAPVDVPSYQTGNGTGGEYTSRSTQTNYEVSKEVLNIVRQPGTVERLSVAVLMDENLPAEQADTVQKLVEAAVGFDAERGDQIQVQQVPFNDDFYAKEAALLQQMQQRALYIRIGTIVAILLGLGLVLFFTRKVFTDMQKRMMPYVVEPERAALPASNAQTPVSLQNSASAAYAQASSGSDPEDIEDIFRLPSPDESEMRLRAIARHNPEYVASILQEWSTQ